MAKWKLFFVLISLVIVSPWALAQSPAGTWTTIDDQTGKKRAIVKITVSGDTLTGTIASVFPQPGDKGICINCPDSFKDKPIKGLQIIWGLKDKGNDVWDDGQILDPKTGKIYRAKITVDGNKLYVRGYIGVSMLGRTQIWVR